MESSEHPETVVDLPCSLLFPEPKARTIIEDPFFLWKEPPYPHEVRTVLAFAYLLKRQHCGTLDENDVKGATRFLEWLVSLDPESQVEPGRDKKRGCKPPLLSGERKEIIRAQIETMKNLKSFLGQKDWEAILVGMFRGHVFCLNRAGLFKESPHNIKYLQETIVKNTR